MRKSQLITVADKETTVKELKIKQILGIFGCTKDAELYAKIKELLPNVLGLSIEELQELTGSEAKKLWEVVKEVNSDFLAILEDLGLSGAKEEFIKAIKAQIKATFSTSFNNSLARGTQAPLNTATQPSKVSQKPIMLSVKPRVSAE